MGVLFVLVLVLPTGRGVRRYTLAGSRFVQVEVLEKLVALARYAWMDNVLEKKRKRRGSESMMVKKMKFYQTGIFQAIAAFVFVPILVSGERRRTRPRHQMIAAKCGPGPGRYRLE